MLFAHKKFLVTAELVEEDTIIETISGEIPLKKGEWKLTDIDGNTFPITHTRFKDYYVSVDLAKEKQPRKKPSPFEEAYAKQLVEFGGLNQTEDETYIQGTKKLVQNKVF